MPPVKSTRITLFLLLSLFLSLWMPGLNAQPAAMAPDRAQSLIPVADEAAAAQLQSERRVLVRAVHSDVIPPRVPAPPAALGPATVQGAIINVIYVGVWDSAAQDAFEHAVTIWENLVVSPVPITVEAKWQPMGPSILGGAGPYNFWRNFSNAPTNSTWYPAAIANSLAGTDLDGGTDPEIQAVFSSTFSNWYFGTDGQPGSGQYDFVSVVLHELGHGLGFSGSMMVDNGSGSVECNGQSGHGCWGYSTGNPFVYDLFTQNGSGQSLINTGLFGNPSSSLGSQLTSGNIFFNGPNAVAANGGTPPRMYAPGSWQQGSSYSHLDESTYSAGTANALMTPMIGNGEANHSPGPLALGIFADSGWNLAATNTAPAMSSLPDQSLLMGSSRDNAIDLWTYASDGEAADSALTFTIDNSPPVDAGISLDGNRYIDINPDSSWTGEVDVTIRVTDPDGASDTDSFTVRVSNSAPLLSSLPDQTVDQNGSSNNGIDLWAYTMDGESADSDLTFTIANSPSAEAGVTLDSNRYIDVNPSGGWSGQTDVVINVTDPGGAFDSQTFIVYVVPPGSTPPVIENLPGLQIPTNNFQNDAIDLWAYSSDAESADSDLNFSIENSPAVDAGVSIDSNRYVDINPTANWSGETTITIRVTAPDGFYARDSFDVRIGSRLYLPVIRNAD